MTIKKYIHLIAIIAMFTACTKDKEEVNATAQIEVNCKDSNGESIDISFVLFKDGNYEPKEYNWGAATIKDNEGNTVFWSYISTKNSIECKPGKYQVIILIPSYIYLGSNKVESYKWKSKIINAEAGKITTIDAVLNGSIIGMGFVEWDK